ncbi:predicted protein [Streptomyces lividans TK24]|uniref:Uncharacterized protein n=1 Tax=Streptomyces lividans 1326 TaxID=1200984 RepID=A0A7U9DJ00_STRLI|nr:predicted protein [Streptomyces lividans TK24]EOY44851.1 hypothetical protein SLI_0132 [Streptomyces lividans 1326]
MTKSCPAASTDGLGPEAMATGRTRRPYRGVKRGTEACACPGGRRRPGLRRGREGR